MKADGDILRAVEFTVTGRVQGVGFRWFVLATARKLELRGYVRNRPDGSVKVVAAGPPRALARLHAALLEGPPLAHVKEVQAAEFTVPPELPAEFAVY